MTEAKSVFVEDLRIRKDLMRSAKHKTKIGPRQGNSFAKPSEHWKTNRKKNGAVMTYEIGKPISWETFKRYPKEMQQEWVNNFVERFNCSARGMGLVFGVKDTSVYGHCKKCGVSLPKTGVYTDKKGDMIRAWIAEYSCDKTEAEQSKETAKQPEIPYFIHTLKKGEVALEGSANEICQTLYGIFREGRMRLHVTFEMIEEAAEEEVQDAEVV